MNGEELLAHESWDGNAPHPRKRTIHTPNERVLIREQRAGSRAKVFELVHVIVDEPVDVRDRRPADTTVWAKPVRADGSRSSRSTYPRPVWDFELVDQPQG